MREVMRSLKTRDVNVSALGISAASLGELIRLVDGGKVSGSAAKQVFERMQETGESAEAAVKAAGLTQMDDGAELEGLAQSVIAEQAEAVASYRGGKTGTLGFLVGQVMRKSGGKANPKQVSEILRRLLA